MIHVVDDDQMLGEMLAEMVCLFSDESRYFSSPVEYLEYVNSPDYQKPLAIFTDINMPEMDGYDLIESVHALYPDQKFVVITGRPDINHPYKNHACFYLCKPFHAEDIQKLILALKKCECDGPPTESVCTETYDRSRFSLKDWSCPHLGKS